jgi:hypothetical protein
LGDGEGNGGFNLCVNAQWPEETPAFAVSAITAA